MFYHNLKIAWRNLLKYKTQTLISLIGLSVGLFSFSLCCYLFRYWMSEDDGFPNHNRIAEIVMMQEESEWAGTPAGLAVDMREKNFTGIEGITAMAYNRPYTFTLERADGKEVFFDLAMAETDSNFVEVFGCSLLKGNLREVYISPDMLLLTKSCADKVFGDDNPIGAKLTTQDNRIFTVGGIIEDLPRNNSLSLRPFEILAFSVTNGRLTIREPGRTGCLTYALLNRGNTVKMLNQQLKSSGYSINDYTFTAHPLGKQRSMEFILFYGFILLIGTLVLLSTLLNFFSFAIGTFLNRIREFTIRRVSGQSGFNLFFLLFTELFFCFLLSGIIAMSLTELIASRTRFDFFAIQVDFDVPVLLLQIIQYIFAGLVISVLVCLTFTFRVYNMNLQTGMKKNRYRTRNVLLVFQFFICLLFISAGMVAYMQSVKGNKKILETLSSAEKERIYFIRTDYPQFDPGRKVVFDKLKADSRIEDILKVNDSFFEFNERTSVSWEGSTGYLEIFYISASPNITSFLNLPVLQGMKTADERALLIDTRLAEQTGGFAEGKMLELPALGQRNISGVISPVHRWPYQQNQMSVLWCTEDGKNCYIKIVPGKEKEVVASVHSTLKDILPLGIEPEIVSLKKQIDREQSLELTLRKVFLFFGIVCLIVTLLGIYSAISLDTVRRQKEVAIRKINGGRMKDIVLLFVKLYVYLLLAGGLGAFTVVWFGAGILLQDWPVRFNYNNPLFWIAILVGIGVVCGLTVMIKILRIARINPADVVKSE